MVVVGVIVGAIVVVVDDDGGNVSCNVSMNC